MKIDSLKDLERLIKLLRKSGVHTFKLDGMEFELGQLPSKTKPQEFVEDPMEAIQVPQPNLLDPIAASKAMAAAELQKIQDYIETDELTEEQLLNYSVRQEPGTEEFKQ